MLSCLDYPLDIKAILRKKKTLKKQLQSEKQYQTEKNIAILGGSTTSEIRDIIELFLLKYGINPNFYESGYNRYYEDAVFENVELRNFRPDIIYLHTTNVNITQYPSAKHSVEEVAECFNYELEKYRSIWTSLLKYDCAALTAHLAKPY